MIDLRSDTVTPAHARRCAEAMAARRGRRRRLRRRSRASTRWSAGRRSGWARRRPMLVPTGTMGNLCAVLRPDRARRRGLRRVGRPHLPHGAGRHGGHSAGVPYRVLPGERGGGAARPLLRRGAGRPRRQHAAAPGACCAWRPRTTRRAASVLPLDYLQAARTAAARAGTAWPCTSTARGCSTRRWRWACRCRTIAGTCRHRDVLPVQGPGRAGRLRAVRAGGGDPRGRGRRASCWAARCGRRACWRRPGWWRWTRHAWSGWRRTTAGPGAWRRGWRRAGRAPLRPGGGRRPTSCMLDLAASGTAGARSGASRLARTRRHRAPVQRDAGAAADARGCVRRHDRGSDHGVHAEWHTEQGQRAA